MEKTQNQSICQWKQKQNEPLEKREHIFRYTWLMCVCVSVGTQTNTSWLSEVNKKKKMKNRFETCQRPLLRDTNVKQSKNAEILAQLGFYQIERNFDEMHYC